MSNQLETTVSGFRYFFFRFIVSPFYCFTILLFYRSHGFTGFSGFKRFTVSGFLTVLPFYRASRQREPHKKKTPLGPP